MNEKERSQYIRLDVCKIIFTSNFVILSQYQVCLKHVILFVQLFLAGLKSSEFSDLRLILMQQSQNSVLMPSFQTFSHFFWQSYNYCFNICYPSVATIPPLRFLSLVLCRITALTNTPVSFLPNWLFLIAEFRSIHDHKCGLFYGGATAVLCQCLLIIKASRSHSVKHTTLGRTSLDKWSAPRRQYTTLTTDRHPCVWRDSKPQSQQASGCGPAP